MNLKLDLNELDELIGRHAPHLLNGAGRPLDEEDEQQASRYQRAPRRGQLARLPGSLAAFRGSAAAPAGTPDPAQAGPLANSPLNRPSTLHPALNEIAGTPGVTRISGGERGGSYGVHMNGEAAPSLRIPRAAIPPVGESKPVPPLNRFSAPENAPAIGGVPAGTSEQPPEFGVGPINPRIPPEKPAPAHRGLWSRLGRGALRVAEDVGRGALVGGVTTFAPQLLLSPAIQRATGIKLGSSLRGQLLQSEVERNRAERDWYARRDLGTPPKERTVEIGGQPTIQDYGPGGWVTEPGVSPYEKPTATRPLTLGEQEGRDVDELMGQTNPATGKPYSRTEAIQAVRGAAQAPGRITTPFEAIMSGTPEQRKAAQDFLDFEGRIKARYRSPNEFEERYRLFQTDPDAYRKMFGEKGGVSPAEARMMLNYFDKRRQEVNKDYTLSDADKQQALQEIEQLEQPFLAAAQGAAGAGAPRGATVVVISPDGVRGTIPRANVQKARKKGYRLAQ